MQSAPDSTSTAIASAIGLPVSLTSNAASSALRARRSRAASLRMRPRAAPVIARHSANPAPADATARSTSSADACCTSASTAPVAGLWVANVSPDVASTRRPPMYSPDGAHDATPGRPDVAASWSPTRLAAATTREAIASASAVPGKR